MLLISTQLSALDVGNAAFKFLKKKVFVRSLMLDRYWEVDLWDNVFDQLLNSDSRESGESGTATILARLEDLLTAYMRDCPSRLRELRELLRRQDNMLHSR